MQSKERTNSPLSKPSSQAIMNSAIVNKSFIFINWLYKEFLPIGYRDFQLDQSMELKNNCVSKGLQEGLCDEELEIVATSAILHNVGCIEGALHDKRTSIAIASNFLSEMSYAKEKTALVIGCIAATQENYAARSVIESLIQDVKFNLSINLQAQNILEIGDFWP